MDSRHGPATARRRSGCAVHVNVLTSSHERRRADIILEKIIARLCTISPAIKAGGVTRLAVFRSRARGDARPDSDLDILFDTTVPPRDFVGFDLLKVMHLIKDATGVQTQISMRDLLKPRISERIDDDLVEVF
jgi:predicted nucleotidyltransferase